jgi:hypothetical protein
MGFLYQAEKEIGLRLGGFQYSLSEEPIVALTFFQSLLAFRLLIIRRARAEPLSYLGDRASIASVVCHYESAIPFVIEQSA